MIRWLALFLVLALPARGEEVIANLSQNRIAITADFDGSEILVFGAVKREAPIDPTGTLGVIVTVSGPKQPVIVRRKEPLGPIWVNRTSVEVDAAPSFYAVAGTAPLYDILSFTEDLRHRVSIPRAIRSVGAPDHVENAETFTDALIRIRSAENLYQNNDGAVGLLEDTLFDTSVELPARLIEGNYTVRILLTRDKAVLHTFETVVYVQKVGLERFLYTLAHDQPLIYGLLSIALAIVAGWGASAVFVFARR